MTYQWYLKHWNTYKREKGMSEILLVTMISSTFQERNTSKNGITEVVLKIINTVRKEENLKKEK